MPATAECCVCGKDASLLCGACVKEGVRLAFCSKEHQKLVWFAHKPICGPGKARLVPPPALNKVEEDLYRSEDFQDKLLRSYTASAQAESGVRLCERMLSLPEGSFREHASDVSGWVEGLKSNPQRYGLVVRFIRESLYNMLAIDHTGIPLVLPAYTFAFALLGSFRGREVRIPSERMPELVHRATISAGLTRILDGQAPNLGHIVDAELVRGNFKRLIQPFLEYIEVLPGGNFQLILGVIGGEFDHIPALQGSGIHFKGGDVSSANAAMRATEVWVTRPGEVAPGERLLAMGEAGSPNVRILQRP